MGQVSVDKTVSKEKLLHVHEHMHMSQVYLHPRRAFYLNTLACNIYMYVHFTFLVWCFPYMSLSALHRESVRGICQIANAFGIAYPGKLSR